MDVTRIPESDQEREVNYAHWTCSGWLCRVAELAVVVINVLDHSSAMNSQDISESQDKAEGTRKSY